MHVTAYYQVIDNILVRSSHKESRVPEYSGTVVQLPHPILIQKPGDEMFHLLLHSANHLQLYRKKYDH